MDKEVAGKNHKGNTQAQTEEQKKQISLGGTGYGQDIIRGHGEIGDNNHPDGLPKRFQLPSWSSSSWSPFHKKFDGYPYDDRTADKFYELHLKELGGKKSQDHTKNNGRPAPKAMPLIRCFRGRDRTAMAMTTALSPARMRSIRTMLKKPTTKSQLKWI